MLSGCTDADDGLQRCMKLRERLLTGGCSFETVVTADYGEAVYTFALNCDAEGEGAVSFCVASPEEITGISGTIDGGKGKFVFDDTVLAFPLLAEGEVSPVSAPWLLIRALRSGFMASAGKEGDLLRLSVNDSYEADALRLDVWLDGQDKPVRAEILWQGRRVLSMEIKEFDFV